MILPDDDRVAALRQSKAYAKHPADCACPICQYLRPAQAEPAPKKRGRQPSVNECGHPERPHRAKKMCNACYRASWELQQRIRLTPRAWNCEHVSDAHHSRGLCHKCYQRWLDEKHGRKRNHGHIKSRAWACLHTDRPHHGHGLCKPCCEHRRYEQTYKPKRRERVKVTACEHTGQPHHALGYCTKCYQAYDRKQRKERRNAKSHPANNDDARP